MENNIHLKQFRQILPVSKLMQLLMPQIKVCSVEVE